jgi:hypothetical protein
MATRVPRDPEVRRLRARAAGMARHHPELADDARRDLKAAVAAQYVRDLVDTWPPLTEAQRGRLAALLAGNTAGEGGDGGAP